MDAKKLAYGTLVGGAAIFLLGFLFYGILLMKFFTAQEGSATGVSKEPMEFWALALGNLALGALLTYIFERWAGITTFAGGLKGGLVVGFLMSLSFDLTMYGTSNIMTLTGALVDVVVYTVMIAVAGGLIGWLLGKMKGGEA